MSVAASRVLLLGWNEASGAQEPTAQSLRMLVGQLAPLAELAVLLPQQPEPALVAGATGRVVGLAELESAGLLAAAAESPRPARWQAPAAPYRGSSNLAGPEIGRRGQVPAAPYQGATPTERPFAEPLAVPALPPSRETAPATEQPSEQEPSDQISGQPNSAIPDAAAPADSAANGSASGQDTAGQLRGTAASTAASGQPTRVPTTLTEALAARGRSLPSADAADLNYQVIQYARFATSWTVGQSFAVIYAVNWLTWLAAMEIRQLTGRPLVLHVHSLAQERAAPAEAGWGLALERLALRRADLVLASSAEIAQLLTERYALPPERLRTVSPGDASALHALLQHVEQHSAGSVVLAPITPPQQ